MLKPIVCVSGPDFSPVTLRLLVLQQNISFPSLELRNRPHSMLHFRICLPFYFANPNIQKCFATASLSIVISRALYLHSAPCLEVGYNNLVPKLPKHYAALVRAAVWDCVLVAVLAAQLVDLMPPAAADGTHPYIGLFFGLSLRERCVGGPFFDQDRSTFSRMFSNYSCQKLPCPSFPTIWGHNILSKCSRHDSCKSVLSGSVGMVCCA